MDDEFWINVSQIAEDEIDTAVDPQHVFTDTSRATEVAFKQATDVENYLLNEKYTSIERESLRDDNPAFSFLRVPSVDTSKRYWEIPKFYNGIQRHAVALQAMMQDTGDDIRLFELLEDAKRKMIGVLDQLELLMMAVKIEKMEDVRKEVMPNEFRRNYAKPDRDVYCTVKYVNHLKLLKKYLQDRLKYKFIRVP